MRQGTRLWILLALLAAGAATAFAEGLPRARPEDVGMSSERLTLLDDILKDALNRKDFPGAVLLVTRKGKTVWRKAYGDSQWIPERRPMKADMIFDLASLTKPVATATSIMILVERGKIRLSDTIKTYVPEFTSWIVEKDLPGEDACLWHLLTHTSGLPAYLDPKEIEAQCGRPCPVDLLVKRIGKLIKESPPGKKFVYSCLNYIVLAFIIKAVSGQDIAEFAAENIFKPLGMNRTFFNPADEFIDICVPTQVVDGKLLRGIVHDPLAGLQGGVSGNAGLFSTADDLAVFIQMMLNGGKFGTRRILSPLAVERMTEIFPMTNDSGRGLGWDLNSEYATVRGDLLGRSSYGHSGYTGTSVWVDPETHTSVIFLSNRVHPDDKGAIKVLRSKVANVVAAAIEKK